MPLRNSKGNDGGLGKVQFVGRGFKNMIKSSAAIHHDIFRVHAIPGMYWPMFVYLWQAQGDIIRKTVGTRCLRLSHIVVADDWAYMSAAESFRCILPRLAADYGGHEGFEALLQRRGARRGCSGATEVTHIIIGTVTLHTRVRNCVLTEHS